MTQKLSILICSLAERKEQLDDLLAKLGAQVLCKGENGWDYNKDVEVLVDIDSGEKTISQKRNDLLAQAQGDYVCFIDDDDQVPDYYIAEILKAIEAPKGDSVTVDLSTERPLEYVHSRLVLPDVVGFRGRYFINSKEGKPFIHSIRYKEWLEDNKAYYRCPNHTNPVKRELALKAGFTLMASGEDRDYSLKLRPLLKTEAFIDKPMYFYYYANKYSRGNSTKYNQIKKKEVLAYDPYSTSQQALVYAVMRTTGPVVELGCGFYSTLILHEICKAQKRPLLTFDNNPEWIAKFEHLKDMFHAIHQINDWNSCPFGIQSVGVVLIDHWPAEQRPIWIRKLLPITDILVCHDAECKIHYPMGLDGISKYRKLFNWQTPWTMLLSDTMELNE